MNDAKVWTCHDIVSIQSADGVIPQEKISRIEEIINATKDKGTFLYGLRTLQEQGIPKEQLREMMDSYNKRAPHNYQVKEGTDFSFEQHS